MLLEQETSEHLVLWRAVRAGDGVARGRLIELHLPYARVLAARMFAGRTDSDLEFEDYLQFGTIGLIEAVDRYDPSHGTQFRSFAGHRINGAILNGLEGMSEKREQVSTRQKLLAERRPAVIPAKAGIQGKQPYADLFQQLADVAIGLALGYVLENPTVYQHEEAQAAPNQYSNLEMEQLRNCMHGLVDQLPPRERMLVKYHYLNGLPFSEIAGLMDLTKGRISQIHTSAIKQLRQLLQAVKACDMAW